MPRELIRPPLKVNPANFRDAVAAIDALQRWAEQVAKILNNLVGAIPDASTAADVAGVVADLNSLQAALRDLSIQ